MSNTKIIKNPFDQKIELIFEPWGLSVDLNPDDECKVIFKDVETCEYELEECEFGLVLYVYTVTSLDIYVNDEIEFEDLPAFGAGRGINIRSFIDDIFGGPGRPR